MDSSVNSIKYNARLATRGVTLPELIIVVAIVAVLLAAAQPSYHIIEQQSALAAGVSQYAQALHRAQLLAEAVRGDTNWGVVLSSTSTTLYKGLTYASRDSTYDELYTFAVPFTVTGATEVNFTKFSGTTTPATSTLAAVGRAAHTVSVNAKGMVTY